MDVFRRLLGTTEINMKQVAWALAPTVALLGLWELGKLLVRGWAKAARPPAVT